MRVPLAVCCLLGASLMATAPRAATLDYTWDSAANPATNESFAGPIQYHQVLSATGLTPGPAGFHVHIVYGAPYYPAWVFVETTGFTPGLNCLQHEAFTWTTTPAGCTSIPGLTLQVFISPLITDPTRAMIDVYGQFPAGFAPDPATRYGLVDLIFDLKDAVTGNGGTTRCGGAENPLCFAVLGADEGPSQPMVIGSGFLQWQDPTNLLGCPAVTPVQPRTWGALKLLYR